jgi:hypothetical protein
LQYRVLFSCRHCVMTHAETQLPAVPKH